MLQVRLSRYSKISLDTPENDAKVRDKQTKSISVLYKVLHHISTSGMSGSKWEQNSGASLCA